MGKWTDERVEMLETLWKQGVVARKIADVLGGGITRGAVIGKGNRLFLGDLRAVRREAEASAAAEIEQAMELSFNIDVAPMVPLLAEIKPQRISEQTFRLHAASVKTKCATLPDSLINPVPKAPLVCERVSIWELTRRDQCRWPLGDPKDEDFAFCGLRVADTTVTSYCPGHRQLSITILPKKARAPAHAIKEPLTA